MNNLMILIEQTGSGTGLYIIPLLAVAATIGFVTAWFLVRFLCEKKRKTVESEKFKLNSQLISKIMIINDLHKTLLLRKNEFDYLLKKVEAQKKLNKKAVHQTQEVDIKNKATEQLR